MKVTLNWLRQYVDFDWTPEELTERLTLLGLEVEGVQKLGGAFEGVVVAQVLTRDKHPNADKLSVCRVHDGKGERQIVCGAQNFQAGDKVPLILPGAALPPKPGDKEPFVIKVGKIRGVESHGMMCAADELGLDPEALGLKKEDGLLILRADATVGQPFAEYLGRGGSDVVYDLEVTPNRPDLNSLLGIAREISALTGHAVRLPQDALPAGDPPTASLVAVELEAADLCPRYVARVIRGVRVGPSPDWLKSALEKVGLRSINNVVDVTNFVMLETGQPLHAFDFRLIARGDRPQPTIRVRRAHEGEKFVTLDGREHALSRETLLIADPEKAIALGGVMGGQNTEVSGQTQDILLEAAYFTPTGIRRTSKALGLRTDASYRFERGADPLGADAASRRAAHLILELAGGAIAAGSVDAHPAPPEPRQVSLRPQKVNDLLGLSLAPAEIGHFLAQLGLRPVGATADAPAGSVSFGIPSYRVDLKREADLIEEVARLYGVDKLPSTPPRQGRGSHAFDARYDQIMAARRLLVGLGLNETQGQTLIAATAAGGLPTATTLALANPLSSDMDVLRPSLLPGLLDVLRHNLRRQNTDCALFEIGRVFRHDAGTIREGWRIAIALTGARAPGFWTGADRDARFDVQDLQGLVEEFLEHFGLRGFALRARTEAEGGPLFVESGTVSMGGGKLLLGELGQVHPRLARTYDLRDPVFMAELDLDQLLARRNTARSFKPLAAFPAMRRDIAMIVPETVTHEAVLQAVKQSKAANLESVELFDVFRGGHVPAGQKSLAYALTYRAADRTLTDSDVTAAHEKVVAQFRQSLGAALRE